MNFRQVHLDFHTSEAIEGIGTEFNKKEFQEALKIGHIDSITLFSKCHHGWSYHPTKVGKMHPDLKFDLLKSQIEAAHEIGVKTVVYLSAGLDEQLAVRHPEWLIRKKDETTTWAENFAVPGYHLICMNSPYLAYLTEQVKEVAVRYEADGIFMDITGIAPCYCHNCIAQRRNNGVDPYDEYEVMRSAEEKYIKYTTAIRKAIDEIKPELPLFHNCGHIRRGRRDLARVNSHLEIEALPTGGWGYDYFPLSARYAQGLGMEYLGMTGKFHYLWGEFGGFKHPNALKYETCLCVANGAKCSVGDQLHPNGKMDRVTYSLIGDAYKDIEKKEPWLDKVQSVADIGVVTYEAVSDQFTIGQVAPNNEVDIGTVRILSEGKYLFDVIDFENELDKYKVIILPDNIKINNDFTDKLRAFTKNGGKLLATGKSLIDEDKKEFIFDFGGKYIGENEFVPSYFKPDFETEGIKNTCYVVYSQGEKVQPVSGKSLARTVIPYFNRTTEHFCSHFHTPDSGISNGTGMIQGNDGIYIPWQIFTDYALHGNIVYKHIVMYALDLLLSEEKTLSTDLPAQGIVTLMDQKAESRYICHLLYASPVKRGGNIEVIEDVLPVYNTKVKIKIDKAVRNVYLAPSKTNINFIHKDGMVEFVVDKIECHQMVVIDYK